MSSDLKGRLKGAQGKRSRTRRSVALGNGTNAISVLKGPFIRVELMRALQDEFNKWERDDHIEVSPLRGLTNVLANGSVGFTHG
jgi:hypothetical protein